MNELIADKIRFLREQDHMTQAELAKKLGISRSAVNAWEMSLSDPSISSMAGLCRAFRVSADYLLGTQSNLTLDISDLEPEAKEVLMALLRCLQKKQDRL